MSSRDRKSWQKDRRNWPMEPRPSKLSDTHYFCFVTTILIVCIFVGFIFS